MKRLMFALLVCGSTLLLVSPVCAKGLLVGAKGGLDLARLFGDLGEFGENTSIGFKPGFVGGIFVSADLGGALSGAFGASDLSLAIQLEALYAMKGAKLDYEYSYYEFTERHEEKLNLNYVSIPVLAKVGLPKMSLSTQEAIKPSIYAGPVFSFRVSKDPGLSVFDFGIAAGAMVEYEMNVASISVEARYEAGLRHVWKESYFGGNLKNGNLQFMMGVGFPLSLEQLGISF